MYVFKGTSPRLPTGRERDVSVTKLGRTRHQSGDAPPHAMNPHHQGKPSGARHSARHARTSHVRSRARASLAIRSAERRRWSPDLTGPGAAGLVLYGADGIGKSTLAAQI